MKITDPRMCEPWNREVASLTPRRITAMERLADRLGDDELAKACKKARAGDSSAREHVTLAWVQRHRAQMD